MFLKANAKLVFCEIFVEVAFAKINSREILRQAQFAKINSRAMSEKNSRKINSREKFSLKVIKIVFNETLIKLNITIKEKAKVHQIYFLLKGKP